MQESYFQGIGSAERKRSSLKLLLLCFQSLWPGRVYSHPNKPQDFPAAYLGIQGANAPRHQAKSPTPTLGQLPPPIATLLRRPPSSSSAFFWGEDSGPLEGLLSWVSWARPPQTSEGPWRPHGASLALRMPLGGGAGTRSGPSSWGWYHWWWRPLQECHWFPSEGCILRCSSLYRRKISPPPTHTHIMQPVMFVIILSWAFMADMLRSFSRWVLSGERFLKGKHLKTTTQNVYIVSLICDMPLSRSSSLSFDHENVSRALLCLLHCIMAWNYDLAW